MAKETWVILAGCPRRDREPQAQGRQPEVGFEDLARLRVWGSGRGYRGGEEALTTTRGCGVGARPQTRRRARPEAHGTRAA